MRRWEYVALVGVGLLVLTASVAFVWAIRAFFEALRSWAG